MRFQLRSLSLSASLAFASVGGAQEADLFLTAPTMRVAATAQDEPPLPTVPETVVTPPQETTETQPDDANVPPPTSMPNTSSESNTPVELGDAPVPVPAQSMSGSGSAPADAPNRPGPSSDTVVTANRLERTGNRVGGSLTVISRDAIRNSGQISVADVLQTVPGLDMVRQGGLGQQASVFMRGANSNQTKVLLDGMPINDPGSPGRAFDFGTLTVDEIERIEVLRGPQSTLYGSDAIGGVINIITRKGGEPATVISSEGGSFSTSRTTARRSGGNDRMYYSIGGSYTDTNGFSAAALPPGNTEADFFRSGVVSGRLGYDLTERWTVDVVARHQDSDTGTDGFPPPTFTLQDDDSSLEQETTYVRAQSVYNAFDGMWIHRLGSGYTQYQRQAFSTFGGVFYGRQGRLDWQNDLWLIKQEAMQWLVTSGIDFNEEVARNATVPQARQGNLAGFVQSVFDIGDRLNLTAGARWDDYSLVGDAFTYRVTGRYDVTEDSAIHGALGTGFRAPALDELFGVVGNPLLNPEQSKGWEVGWQQRLFDSTVTLDATYFRNDFDDFIIFVLDPTSPLPFGGQLENIQQALAAGVELTSLWSLTEQTTAFANYTYTDTRNRTEGGPLLRRPRDKWSLGVSRTLPDRRANMTLQALYIGDRADFGTVLDDYWLVNVAGWWQLSPTCRWFGRVDNLLDQEFQPVAGYQGIPISAYSGLELRF